MNNHALTIPELNSLISRKFQEIVTQNSKKNSLSSSNNFRGFISLCTSISIKLLQYDLLQETLSVLIKASEADKLLCEIGNMQDQY